MVEVNKDELRFKFGKNWEKHYKLDALVNKGFKRQKCKKCGRYFWSVVERDYCSDPSCIGYQFIGDSPVKKNLTYVETWKEIEKYFTKNGHKSIKPFPTVARWRDDLYFTLASINDFQPYVVNGEVEPIANPLIVPQPCIRFNDIDNVGVTGRHYTNFVMIGQHAFNTENTGLFYWKEEAIEHDIGYLTYLGLPLEEIVFHEDVWAGGGNFGPSMEYFVRGLELGNCVFMQYEVLANGSTRELKTKVIDMGAGLSRFAWILRDDPTSYEVVFGKAIDYLKKENSVKYDEELFLKYAKLSGALNLDEVEDIQKLRNEVLSALSLSEEEFSKMFNPLQSLYAIADHSLTLLFTIRDGMMPSNSGGGYNLRTLSRRMFSMIERYGFEVDWNKLLFYHMENLKGLFDEYKEAVDVVSDVLEEEKKKYEAQKHKAKKKIFLILKKKKSIDVKELISLYKSEGIMPEHLASYAKEFGINIEIPDNFYKLVKEESVSIKRKGLDIDVINYPKTEKLYYLTPPIKEFKAIVLGVEKDYVVLNRTAFYPEGGGQVGDTGSLNGIKVLDTKKKMDVILHKVREPSRFKKGEEVVGKIDWDRRIQISQHHTTTHILTSVARNILGKHVWQAGAKKDEDKAHIDLTHYKKITKEELDRIEYEVNRIILRDVPIIVEELPRNIAESKYGFSIYQGGAVPGKNLRLVSIKGVDVEACGGTHNVFTSTSQLGFFKIVKRQGVKDGVERIVFKSGMKAVEYVKNLEDNLIHSSSIFSVNPDQLPSVSKRFFEEWKKQKQEIKDLSSKLAAILLDNAIKVKIKFVENGEEKQEELSFIYSELNEGLIFLISRNKNVIVSNGSKLIVNSSSPLISKLSLHIKRSFPNALIKGNDSFLIINFKDKKSKKDIEDFIHSLS